MFWGYAPALDLLRELEKSQNKDLAQGRNDVKVHTRVRGDESDKDSGLGGGRTSPVSDDGGSGRDLERGDSKCVREGSQGEPSADDGGDARLGEGSGDNVLANPPEEAGGRRSGAGSPRLGERGAEPGAERGAEPDSGRVSKGDAPKWREDSKDLVDIFSGFPEGIDSSSGMLGEDNINILLVGSCDARHIFKTMSRLHSHVGAPVRFYVLDPLMEMVCRQLLLLYAALQPPSQLGLKEKVRLLMEVTGNTLVRPVTASWVTKAAKELQKMVTNDVYLHQKMPQVRLEQLRYQEKDQLEDVCSFWQGRPHNFRIGFHWDQRLRKTLKNRYDNRSNLFDWDYYMILKEMHDGDRVCMREYKNWRSSGVAFTWLEAEPSIPNVTMATGIFREGRNLLHHGYLGDLRISPFIAYSLEVESEDEKDMWIKRNNAYARRSTDVAERHLERITYEMIHQVPYVPPVETATTLEGVIITQITDLSHMNPEAPPVDEELEDPTRRRRLHADATADPTEQASIPADVQVVFVSAKLLRDPGSLRRVFSGKVDVAVVASVLADAHVHDDLLGAMRDGGLLLVEGSRFHLHRKAELEEISAKLMDKIAGVGFQREGKFNAFKDNYARFRVRRSP